MLILHWNCFGFFDIVSPYMELALIPVENWSGVADFSHPLSGTALRSCILVRWICNNHVSLYGNRICFDCYFIWNCCFHLSCYMEIPAVWPIKVYQFKWTGLFIYIVIYDLTLFIYAKTRKSYSKTTSKACFQVVYIPKIMWIWLLNYVVLLFSSSFYTLNAGFYLSFNTCFICNKVVFNTDWHNFHCLLLYVMDVFTIFTYSWDRDL